MANKQVRVTICGTGYTLSTDDAEEYVLRIADQVEKSMKTMMNENDRISTLMAAVITALNNADDAAKATVSADNLRARSRISSRKTPSCGRRRTARTASVSACAVS